MLQRRLGRLTLLGLLVVMLLAAAPEAAAQDRPGLVPIVNLESAFGSSVMEGIDAALAYQRDELAFQIEEPIHTGNWLADTPLGQRQHAAAIGALHNALAAGTRLFLGAESTGSTDYLLDRLSQWALDELEKGQDPGTIVLLSPVSTSTLWVWEDRWEGGRARGADHVQVFRTAVSDRQALSALFRQQLTLSYDATPGLEGTIVPGEKAMLQSMVAVVESSGPAARLDSRDMPTTEEWDAVPAGDYAKGFLRNLWRILEDQDAYFVKDVLLWSHEAIDSPESRRLFEEWMEEVIRDRNVRSLAIIGYAPFIRAVNSEFMRLSRGDFVARRHPQSFFRFTGGTLKMSDLSSRALPGTRLTYDGLHFFSTVPQEDQLTARERSILEFILQHSESDEIDELEDHVVQTFMTIYILDEVSDRVLSHQGQVTPDLMAAQLNRLDPGSTSPRNVLVAPFYWITPTEQGVRFRSSDIEATRHVFYVQDLSSGSYAVNQVDILNKFEVPWTLVVFLAIGLAAGVGTLTNWDRVGAILSGGEEKPPPLGIPNPYIYGVPVRSPDLFFGRRDSFRILVEQIERGPFIMLITGGRRSGKSSFLYFIKQGGLPGQPSMGQEPISVPEHVVAVDFDLQEVATYPTEAELTAWFLDEIDGALKERVPDFQSPSDVEGANPYATLTNYLHEVHAAHPDTLVLLLMDEIEELNERMLEGTLSREFPQFLKARVQDPASALSIIFTGSHIQTFSFDAQSLWTKLRGNLQFINLGPLSENDTKALATDPIREHVEVPEEVAERVYVLTNGQPFLTQAICHMAVNELNNLQIESLPATMTSEIMDAAVATFVDNTPGHVFDMWSRFTRLEKYLLLVLSRRSTGPHDRVSIEELLAFARRESFEIVDSVEEEAQLVPVCKRTLDELPPERKLIDARRVDGELAYGFTVDLMRLWLRNESIWPAIDAAREAVGANSEEGSEEERDG